MDEEENTDIEKISDEAEHGSMLSEGPHCPPQEVGLSPSLEFGDAGYGDEKKKNGEITSDETGLGTTGGVWVPRDVTHSEDQQMDESANDYDTECDEKLVINENYDNREDVEDKKIEVEVKEEKENAIIKEENFDDYQEMDINNEEIQEPIKKYIKSESIEEQEDKDEMKDYKEIKKETYSTTTEITKKKSDEDKEEGELEEGELEDDDGEEEEEEEEEEEAPEEKKEEEKEPEKNEMEIKEEPKKEKTKDNDNDKESKDKREKEEKKRKHKETEDERKKRKKKKHYSSEDDETQKKKFASRDAREKPYDFDTLLKQEMYHVGSSNSVEAAYSSEGGGSNSFSAGYSPYKGPVDGESYESVSGEEWDGKLRRRTKRKRRSSRSPSRKNEAICMFYLQGSCKRGNDCPYSHEIAPTRKMELCKFYMMDCCAKKEKCLYMHKDFPCKYFHFGMKCKAGEQCKFSHDPLQEITKNILLKHIELAPKDILGDFPRVSKHNAQTIISVTEAKRKGETVEADNLEPLLVLEGKGFKYLDRALKNIKKKKDGDKKGEKDKEKEEKERSPRKISRSREDYRDSEKDKEREKDKDRDKEKDRDREKDRDKDKERDKDKDRDKDRNRNRSSRSRDPRRHKSKDYSSRKSRESSRMDHQSYPNPSDLRDKEGYGRSYDSVCPSPGVSGHNTDNMKWYSSDEEGDSNSTQGYRRNENCPSPQSQKQRMDSSSQEMVPHRQFSVPSALPDIDVMYLKNVLSTVQSQSSQNQNFKNVNSGNEDMRGPNNWDSRGNRYSPRDGRASFNYMDISNDIKEVFYDDQDQKDNSKKDEFSNSITSLLQRARSRTSSYPDYREEFRERGPPNYREELREGSGGPPNYREELREGSGINSSKDFRYQNPSEPPWNQNISGRPSGRDDPFNLMGMRQDFLGNNERKQDYLDNNDRKQDFPIEGSYGKEMNPWENKRDVDSRLNGIPCGSKGGSDFRERGVKSEFVPSNRINDVIDNTDLERSNSIYDFDYRPDDNVNQPLDMEDDMRFKVPVHLAAKEINASFNTHSMVFYQLVKIDIPKPDFSRIKVKQDDPRVQDDPRLEKMLRRSSLDSPRSPRGKYEHSPLSPNAVLASPPPVAENKESRDPRKLTSRDPRTESKALSRGDVRGDPRMANRPDPRPPSARPDPRMDNRNRSVDPREAMMDADMRELEPGMGTPMFVNGMMEGPYPQFPNLGMSSPILPQGIDPRRRAGLLGPAPGIGPKGVPMGMSGQVNQGMGGNPFLLPQGMGGPPVPYMPGDRGEMMGSNGPFSQGQWSGGGGSRMNCNDPRLNRD